MEDKKPATVRVKSKAWHNVKDSPQICTTRENSQKQVKPRLSKQIYDLGMMIKRGKWIKVWDGGQEARDCQDQE